MERLTMRNSMGVAVFIEPYDCEECYERIWRLPDYGNGSPTDRLADYEDAEEQGLLLRLPCKVGTQVWKIKECSGGGRIPNWHEIYNVNFALELISDFGKTVFLTKEEAEQALKHTENAR